MRDSDTEYTESNFTSEREAFELDIRQTADESVNVAPDDASSEDAQAFAETDAAQAANETVDDVQDDAEVAGNDAQIDTEQVADQTADDVQDGMKMQSAEFAPDDIADEAQEDAQTEVAENDAQIDAEQIADDMQDDPDEEIAESSAPFDTEQQTDEIADDAQEDAQTEVAEDPAPSDAERDAEPSTREQVEESDREALPTYVAKEQNKPRKPLTPKAKKAIAIGAVAVLLIVGIVLGITLPIYFHYKDKIMVHGAEDFANVDKGNHYVLAEDVVIDGDLDLSQYGNLSIDFNTHTLTVNGTLKYATDGSKDAIALGNTAKGAYVEGGALVVRDLQISAPNADVKILSSVQAQTIRVTAGSVSLAAASVASDIVLGAQSVKLSGNISVAEGAKLEIQNCGDAYVNANVVGDLQLTRSHVAVASGARLHVLHLDADSSAEVSGSIETEIVGGAKVAMLQGHHCNSYREIGVLAIDRSNAGDYQAFRCGKILALETFPMPGDLVVEERPDGRIYAVSGKVNQASEYEFTIDDQTVVIQINPNTDEFPQTDITEKMRQGGAGRHSISVRALGQYDFAKLEEYPDGSIVYLSGERIATVYTYSITLDTPSKLRVDRAGENNESVILSFDSVSFADYYEIVIGGTTLTVERTDTERVEFDITAQVASVGAYGIRVSAYSKIAEIRASKQAMISYVTTGTHAKVSADGASATYRGGMLTVNWAAVETAQSYQVVLDLIQNGERVTVNNVCSTTQFAVELPQDIQVVGVRVRVCKSGYYEASGDTVIAVGE